MVDCKEGSKKQGPREDGPALMPCFYGKELNIRPEVAMTCLAAIALKTSSAKSPPLPGIICPANGMISKRNSFWNLHRPEISKLEWAAGASDRDVREFFRAHSAYQTRRWARRAPDAQLLGGARARGAVRVILQDRSPEAGEPPEVPVERRFLPLTDEDLALEERVHRSGDFCVTGRDLAGSPMVELAALDRTAPSSAPADDDDEADDDGKVGERVDDVEDVEHTYEEDTDDEVVRQEVEVEPGTEVSCGAVSGVEGDCEIDSGGDADADAHAKVDSKGNTEVGTKCDPAGADAQIYSKGDAETVAKAEAAEVASKGDGAAVAPVP